jgi:hypothetical protein
MIRARVTDSRTGRLEELRLQLPEAESPQAAYLELQRRIDELRFGASYIDFCASRTSKNGAPRWGADLAKVDACIDALSPATRAGLITFG